MRFDTLRSLLAKAAAEDLEIDHLDVEQAFLNPTLKERIFIQLPPFFRELFPHLIGDMDAFVELNKALYGLKQAPRKWYIMVKEFYSKLGLQCSTADPNVFIGRGVYLPIFVDDKLIIGKRAAVDQIKIEIMAKWKCKDLGPADLFVGFQIEQNRAERSIRIYQTFYITKLLQRLKLENVNPVKLPISAGTVLQPDPENLLEGNKIMAYRQIVGSVLYLANCTRLDISYCVYNCIITYTPFPLLQVASLFPIAPATDTCRNIRNPANQIEAH